MAFDFNQGVKEKDIETSASSGGFNFGAGNVETPTVPTPINPATSFGINEGKPDESIFKKIGRGIIKPVTNFGEDIAGGIIASGGSKAVNDAKEAERARINGIAQLTNTIKDLRSQGKDTTHAVDKLKQIVDSSSMMDDADLNPILRKTNRQVLGDALGTLNTVVSFGSGLSGAGKVLTEPTSILSGALQGAKIGAATGGIYGAVGGGARALSDNADAGTAVSSALVDGLTGAVTGGVIGGITGGISGGIRGTINRKAEVSRMLAGMDHTPEQINSIKDGVSSHLDEATLGEGSAVTESGLLQPKAGQARVDDISQYLDAKLPGTGAGDKFKNLIDPESTNPQELLKTAHDVVDETTHIPKEGASFTNIAGKIEKDPTAVKAIKSGIDPSDVAFIKNSSEEDQTAFRKMYQMAETASGDKAATTRAIEVPGKQSINYAKYIDTQRKEIGSQIGELVDNLPNEPISVDVPFQKFNDNLNQAGVIVKGGKLDFDNSAFDSMPGVQNKLQNYFTKVTSGDKTPAEIYRLRQNLFTDLDLATKTNELPDNATRILSTLRDDLSQPLAQASPEYKALATKYAQTSDALTQFKKILGKNFDFNDDYSSLRAGEVGRRVLGNAAAGPMSVLKQLEDTAKQFGMKSDTSLRNQYLFADFIEKFMGTEPSGGLSGQVTSGVEKAANNIGAVEDVASLNPGRIVKGLAGAVRKVATSPEAKKAALKALIGIMNK